MFILRRFKLTPSPCTSKADCLRDRLNLKQWFLLLICRKHLDDYTDNYTPHGFCTKGRDKRPLCSLCPEKKLLATRQLNRTSVNLFKEQWGQNAVIGTPVCRTCFNDCVEKNRIEVLNDTSPQPPHSQPATESFTDADGVTTNYSQGAHCSQHARNSQTDSDVQQVCIQILFLYLFKMFIY